MNVENHNLAVRVFDALNERGARLDNAAVWTIERVIDASQPDSLLTTDARCAMMVLSGNAQLHTGIRPVMAYQPPALRSLTRTSRRLFLCMEGR